MSSYVRHKIYSPANTQKIWITEYACHALPLHQLWWANGILNGHFLPWGKKGDFVLICLLLTLSCICERGVREMRVEGSERKTWKNWAELNTKKMNQGSIIKVNENRENHWRSWNIPWKNSRDQALLMRSDLKLGPSHEAKGMQKNIESGCDLKRTDVCPCGDPTAARLRSSLILLR